MIEVVDTNTRTMADLSEIHTMIDQAITTRDPDTRTNTFTEADKSQTTSPEEASVEEASLHHEESSVVVEAVKEAEENWVPEVEVK